MGVGGVSTLVLFGVLESTYVSTMTGRFFLLP